MNGTEERKTASAPTLTEEEMKVGKLEKIQELLVVEWRNGKMMVDILSIQSILDEDE